MNDETIFAGNSRDDRLPSETEIEQRIAEIKLRQQKRQQITEQLESDLVIEALKTAVAAGISLADVPGLIEKYADNLRLQENDIQEQVKRIEAALHQIYQSIKEANRAFQLEKWLTIFSRADIALETLDIEMLRTSITAIKQLEPFSRSQLGISTNELVQEAPEWLYTRLEELESDLRWLESRIQEQDFQNEQLDLRDWLKFTSNCNKDKSRLALLRRQKMASLLLDFNGVEYPYEQRFLEIEALLLKGQSTEAQMLIDRMEQELDDEQIKLTPIEKLGIKNRLMHLNQHLFLYLEAQHSLSQAHFVYKAARKPEIASFPDVVQALYVEKLSSALQRLERDRQALPPFVKSCDLKGNKLGHHLDRAIEVLKKFDRGAKNG